MNRQSIVCTARSAWFVTCDRGERFSRSKVTRGGGVYTEAKSETGRIPGRLLNSRDSPTWDFIISRFSLVCVITRDKGARPEFHRFHSQMVRKWGGETKGNKTKNSWRSGCVVILGGFSFVRRKVRCYHRFSTCCLRAFRRLTTIGSTPASPFEASLTMKETRDYLRQCFSFFLFSLLFRSYSLFFPSFFFSPTYSLMCVCEATLLLDWQ